MTTSLTLGTQARSLPMRKVFTVWWPLAASWLLMGTELPVVSALIARLANPEINLAAYGGVVFPISLIIESPIIMLLAASTALSKDWASYLKVRRFMIGAGILLTSLHFLVAFTPLYYLVVVRVLGVPSEIVEPARYGLMIMIPWSGSIAFRRFNQGVLIRFGHTKAIGLGTVIRLSSNVLVLTLGYILQKYAGIIVATSAVATGVVSEAVYVGIVVRPILKGELRSATTIDPALTWKAFWDFYIPLAMTSLLFLLSNPIGSSALSRMPEALASLAVWPVVTGVVFMLRSLGIAYNEVVVALLDEPHSALTLWRFTLMLGSTITIGLFILAATPLSDLWFERVSALSPELSDLARRGIWLALPMPFLAALQSWYQGSILNSKHTRGITESVVVFLITSIIVLGVGVAGKNITGIYIGLAALSASMATQTVWLWYRSRNVLVKLWQAEAV
jgi:hypothetical protein